MTPPFSDPRPLTPMPSPIPLAPALAKTPLLAYIFALVGVLMLGIIGILGIEHLRPNKDNAVLDTMILGMLAPTATALLALINGINNTQGIKDLHIIVNSRLSELLLATAKSERTQGREEGREAALAASPADAAGLTVPHPAPLPP